MNDIEAIAKDAKNFRQAVTQGQPYKPLYIKIKVVWLQFALRNGQPLARRK